MFKNIMVKMASFLLLVSVTPDMILLAESLNDPMRPPGQNLQFGDHNKRGETVWNLTSTLISGGRRVAMINDNLVVVGDDVNGARVMEILNNGVKLKYRNELLYIAMDTSTLRKPVKDKAGDRS